MEQPEDMDSSHMCITNHIRLFMCDPLPHPYLAEQILPMEQENRYNNYNNYTIVLHVILLYY